MRLSSKAVAAVALLSVSPLCIAKVYFGGSGLVSATSADNMKAGFGGKGFLGYAPEAIPMTFEAGYLTTGKMDYENGYFDQNGNIYTNLDLNLTGGYAALGYYGRFGRNGTGGFAKLGVFSGKSKVTGEENGVSGEAKKNTTGALLSGGIDLMLTRNFGFRFDIDALIGVNDFRDLDETHKGVVTTVNAGVIFSFGESGARYARPAPVYTPAVPAPAPAPVYAPVYTPAAEPTPMPEPAPVVAEPAPVSVPPAAPAPAAAPASAHSAFVGSAQLVPGAVLRSGASMKSAGIRTLSDGGSVKLIKRETNAEGPWWMVQLEDGTTGWMIEWGLARISKN